MLKHNLKDWKLYKNDWKEMINADVPGDITIDLYHAKKIPNPYFGLNHRDIRWTTEEDFTYENFFVVDKSLFEQDEIYLNFDGIDTYSEIYLNGILLGKTDNMFIKYRFEVKKLLCKKGENHLQVKMISVYSVMDNLDTTGYFGTFNVARLFLRKAQCHFGWDWAPELCGYGIWGDVYLTGESALRIEDVTYKTVNDGWVSLFCELNYNIRATVDDYGKAIDGTSQEAKQDTLVYRVEKTPGSGDFLQVSASVTGKKNFANLKLENPKLWWPIGYGDQPLYAYEVSLYREGKQVSLKKGRLAFRTIELDETPQDEKMLGYGLKINGEKIFVRGSNWVPIECFTGTVKEEKYKTLIDYALHGNLNMLRVWGGGIYEKDVFYDLCDEKGIMVWQDFMFACSDLPEDDPTWLKRTLEECRYQILRLRNHPSLVYWCGGNEKTGSYGLQISKGDFFVDNVLHGLVKTLDKSRPYARQSPCSYTDVGNDIFSGESHYNSLEKSLVEGVKNYRKLITGAVVPFISECALMGPNSIQTNKKIYPEDKLWPVNEYWEDRLMDNPYGAVLITFANRQKYYAETLYGELKNLQDFTAKGMLMHAELFRAECEMARRNKGKTQGFLNWMYSDIWPSGSWSVIDYFGEPKQVYYQMRKSYAPLLVSFVQNADEKTELIVVNDCLEKYEGKLVYGMKSINGTIIFKKEISICVNANDIMIQVMDCDELPNDVYWFATYIVGGKQEKTLYSPTFWTGTYVSDYTYETKRLDEKTMKIILRANAFAKSVFLSFDDNYLYSYSDNYFDLEAGDEKEIIVTTQQGNFNNLVVTDFAEMTK